MSNLQPTIAQISQNITNRKAVYQTILQLLKNDANSAKEIFGHPTVLEVLENFYSAHIILLCKDTFFFLYQLCKLSIKAQNTDLKAYVSSLIPRLVVTYFYYTTTPEEKKSDIDVLEVLFNEIVKLDGEKSDQFESADELAPIIHIFPDLEAISKESAPNVYSKKIKSSLTVGSAGQENRICKIVGICTSYLNFYQESTIEEFFLLADMMAGVKVNLKELHLSSTSEYTKEFMLVSDSSTKSKILMKCISGLEAIVGLKPSYQARMKKCSTNISLRAANSGQFLAYVFNEAKQLSELEDVFN